MKGYIVMLALCICMCVSFINQSFVLSPGLQFCDIYIMQVTMKVIVYSSIIRKNINKLFKFYDNRDERNMIICDMQRKTE